MRQTGWLLWEVSTSPWLGEGDVLTGNTNIELKLGQRTIA